MSEPDVSPSALSRFRSGALCGATVGAIVGAVVGVIINLVALVVVLARSGVRYDFLHSSPLAEIVGAVGSIAMITVYGAAIGAILMGLGTMNRAIVKLVACSIRLRIEIVFLICLVTMLVTVKRTEHVVRERDELMHTRNGGTFIIRDPDHEPSIPLLWRLYGAWPIEEICADDKMPEDVYRRFVAAYPEARVYRNWTWRR
jgi:hypothetical protein